jgi:2,5-dioxopentanoate dehydrogenase
VKAKLESAPGTAAVLRRRAQSGGERETLQAAGAELVTGGSPLPRGYRFANTLLRVSGEKFLASPEKLQTEAFGNASLSSSRAMPPKRKKFSRISKAISPAHLFRHGGSDDALYEKFAPLLRARVGRLLNDKMPTGVAVSPAMNHGGPFPATGHPGFTAVGIPASLRRFADAAMLRQRPSARVCPPRCRTKIQTEKCGG